MRGKAWALAGAALVFTGGAQAITIIGGRSCGAWLTSHEGETSAAKLATEAWLVGFISGVASESDKDVLARVDAQSIYLWTTNYCKANQLNSLSSAGYRLFLELSETLSK